MPKQSYFTEKHDEILKCAMSGMSGSEILRYVYGADWEDKVNARAFRSYLHKHKIKLLKTRKHPQITMDISKCSDCQQCIEYENYKGNGEKGRVCLYSKRQIQPSVKYHPDWCPLA